MSKLIMFTKAIARYVASGAKNVSKEDYKKRLKECETCPYVKGGTCGVCGCNIVWKAKMKTENCPKNFWDEQT